MDNYIHVLMGVCFTMITGVVIVGCFGGMVFLALLFWNMVRDELDL